MRILWLSHFFPYPPKGGSPQRSFNLLRELARVHDVHLFTFDDRTQHAAAAAEDPSVRALLSVCAQVEVVSVPHGPSRASRQSVLLRNLLESVPYSVSLLRSSEMQKRLDVLCSSVRLDVVHADAIELAPYLIALPARLKVLNHHNVESLLLQRRAEFHPGALGRAYMHLQATKLQRYERTILPQVDLNLAVSEEDRREFHRLVPTARVDVVPNGTDVEYFAPSPEPVRTNHLVFVGGMTWFPNWDAIQYFLKEIWPLVRQQLPDATLELVGRAASDRAAPDLPAGVSMTGFVDDVRPHLASASAVVVPLRVGGGTRLKILDALACGKATVSTSIGCEGLNLRSGEEILVADTAADFARQVVRACTEPELRARLALAGRARIEREYSWDRIGAAYLALIDTTMDVCPTR